MFDDMNKREFIYLRLIF